MDMPEQLREFSFRAADARDASGVAELVDAAYGHYVEPFSSRSPPALF